MKKTVLRYGGLSVLFMVIFFILNFTVFADLDFATQEILGWVGIFLSVIFIYFGIKYFRDHFNKGLLSFGKGMKVGLLILLLPSIAFGLFDIFYVYVINPGWIDTYYNAQIDQLRASLPAEKATAEIKKMEENKEMFSNPLFQFLVMALSVFAAGLIVTVVSSLILRRNNPAAQPA